MPPLMIIQSIWHEGVLSRCDYDSALTSALRLAETHSREPPHHNHGNHVYAAESEDAVAVGCPPPA